MFLVTAAGLGWAAGTGAAAEEEQPTPATPAAYLAEQLRKSPVYLSDQLPRTNPLSARPAFVKEAKRTGVPTYVLVLPGSGTGGPDGDGLLAAVHDRLGKDGLYLLFGGDGGSPEVGTFGVDVPARDAAMATTFELPYDAGTLDTFRHFVDVLRSGDAAQRAGQGADASRAGEEPDKLYTTRTDRENQGFLVGILLTGVPVLLVSVGWYVRRWRGGKGPGLRLLMPVAAGVALVIGVGAPLVYGDTRSDGDPLPTAADMKARTVRVAHGLRDDPVYVDPLAAGLLSPAELDRLRKRAERLEVPVHIAVVPLDTPDESGGDGELLAKRLHSRLGSPRLRPGGAPSGDGVYVIADAAENGELEVVNYGAKLDSAKLYDDTEDLRFGAYEGSKESKASKNGDGRLYPRLEEALRIIGRTPSGPRSGPYLDPMAAEDPVAEDELPSLYSGDFGPGAFMGVVAALAALGVTAAGLAIARRAGLGTLPAGARVSAGARASAGTRASAATRTAAAARTAAAHDAVPQAPARPSAGWLRRTARRELDEMNDEFERLSGELPEAVRTRAWDCLDAATLLLDQEGDNRVDADADPPTLATGLALIRAGRAVLADRATATAPQLKLCTLNPLHGPWSAERKLKLPGEGGAARSRPVCAECRTALDARDGAGSDSRRARAERAAGVVASQLLCLRAPGSGRSAPYEPYYRVPGPLDATQGTDRSQSLTVEQIVRRVREQLGVH
ncbi:hypothetical protein [Streptomyces oryzae]|uniref:hypothetical protein n=1 Tax=Streptomyces oryzae TaxID=1434886 RepID=UPI0027DDFCD5|nr:hypothetical protein [Streptomyces oryzae]